jgi:nucleosome binding factor SPN SPT16 subunit
LTAMAAACGSFFTIALGAIALAFAALARAFALAADGFLTRAAEAEAAEAAEETAAAEAAEETAAAEAAEETAAAEAAEETAAAEASEETAAADADIVMSSPASRPLYLRPSPKKQISSIIFFLARSNKRQRASAHSSKICPPHAKPSYPRR